MHVVTSSHKQPVAKLGPYFDSPRNFGFLSQPHPLVRSHDNPDLFGNPITVNMLSLPLLILHVSPSALIAALPSLADTRLPTANITNPSAAFTHGTCNLLIRLTQVCGWPEVDTYVRLDITDAANGPIMKLSLILNACACHIHDSSQQSPQSTITNLLALKKELKSFYNQRRLFKKKKPFADIRLGFYYGRDMASPSWFASRPSISSCIT